MGNSLGCVKEQTEAAAGQTETPQSLKRKHRFRKKRKGVKRIKQAADTEEYLDVTGTAEGAQTQKKFRAEALPQEQENDAVTSGGEVQLMVTEGMHLAVNSGNSPEIAEEGHVVLVREKLYGELQKPLLMSGVAGKVDSTEGTRVIARIWENSQKGNVETAVPQFASFVEDEAYPVHYNTTFFLDGWHLPVKMGATGVKSNGNPGVGARSETDIQDMDLNLWDRSQQIQKGHSISTDSSGLGGKEESCLGLSGSWHLELETIEVDGEGTVSELSTPSPLGEVVDYKSVLVPQKTVAKSWISKEGKAKTYSQTDPKLSISHSDFSFGTQNLSTAQHSSGYGSDAPLASPEAVLTDQGGDDSEPKDSCTEGSTLSILEDVFTASSDEKPLAESLPAEHEISDIYVGGESGDLSAKEKLLLWTQKLTMGYPGIKCTNFSSCFSDGKMFNAIIHRYRPDLIDMEKVQIQSNQENLEQAFEVAEMLGVTRLLDVEDVDVPSPDEKSVITYVSSIYESFPKVPEGAEGINATDVDLKWQEYKDRIDFLIQWIRQHSRLMADKSFPSNPVELKALYNEYVHFKETEIPAKEEEKSKIQHLYKLLEVWIEFGRLKLPQGYHPNDVEQEWGRLIFDMLEREKAMRPAVERLELLLQIANKIQNGALSCEEKMTVARNTLQADAAQLESGQPVQYEAEVVMYLQECEGLIRQLQVDLQILRDEKYYQVDQLAFRIGRLQDELLPLRLECTNLYRKGHFSNSQLLRPSNLISSEYRTERSLGALPSTTTNSSSSTLWFRKPMTRAELVALSSSEDEGNLRFVYELLAWVEETQMKLEQAEWGSDLPNVEAQREIHQSVHNSVEQLESSLKEARMYESKMSSNFRSSYTETLCKLESQYYKLLETSSLRLRHLNSLHKFVSHATVELIWLNEKEEEELSYDWSENNPNIATKKESFLELTAELEQKEDAVKSLQETAEVLSLENHPAKQTVEAYSAAVQTQWNWIKELCYCVDQHIRDNTAYFQFFSDARESETYLRNLQDRIKRKYVCDRDSSLPRLEDNLQDSMDEKEQLIQSKSSVASLVGRAKTIIQLKPRNPENVVTVSLPIKSICNYRQIEITISKNDECVLEDNGQRTKWKVISPTGNEAMVPSVCFVIPPPSKEAVETASRIEQLYQNVMSLWHQQHINMKSVVSWNYVLKDMKMVQAWNVDLLKSLSLADQQQSMRNLQSHFEDFLEDSRDSQVFSIADRMQLERDVESCKQHYQSLKNTMETEVKDESLSRTYISQLKNIRLHLEECDQRLIRRIQSPTSDDNADQNSAFRIAEQENLQKELEGLKSELDDFREKCQNFFIQSPSATSVPSLRSELNLVVEKMDQTYVLSSVYLDKLKTVDVVLRSAQGVETLVNTFEMKLNQEEPLPPDLQAIQTHQSLLQKWLGDVKEKEPLFTTLEGELMKAKAIGDQLSQLNNERNVDLERQQERVGQLKERWQNIHSQIETRDSELENIKEALQNYRSCHEWLMKWIEETKAQQEQMTPGQGEDSKVLSEQLSQQTALVAEIEQNQSKLDECQKYSQQYSSSVKEYELQLMKYQAFVESQQKSPVKRRRMHSSSDSITQEFMDLRTRYTALVTLTTQHVKYISDALRRLEDEEKVVEEEKQEHLGKVKELLGWVCGVGQALQQKAMTIKNDQSGDLEKSYSELQVFQDELTSKKESVADAIRTTQIFLAKHGHKLSKEEKHQVSEQLNSLKDTYAKLCGESAEQLQHLQCTLTEQAERKIVQEQQAECSHKLDEVTSWMSQAESSLNSQQALLCDGELSRLQQSQNDIQNLQKELQSRAADAAHVIKATEEFLEENRGKLSPDELARVQDQLQKAKEKHQALLQSAETVQKQLDSAVSAAVQKEEAKVKASEELLENQSKISNLLGWISGMTHMEPTKIGNALKAESVSELNQTVDGTMHQLTASHEETVNSHSEMEGDLTEQYEKLKARQQELLSQHPEFLLSIQSAQAFLDKHGKDLSPEEQARLQKNLEELKANFSEMMAQTESSLKQAQLLRDELQKFLAENTEFEAWLHHSEQKLEQMKFGKADVDSLRSLIQQQAAFSEDVISHKGDLRYITIAGQKVLDMVRTFGEKKAPGEEKGSPDYSTTSTLVAAKLKNATDQYNQLHSECSRLGSHLNSLLEKSQQFQEIANSLESWLQGTEKTAEQLLSEAVASDPHILHTQLENIKVLQGELAEHQVQVDRLKKAASTLLELKGDPSLNHEHIQQSADSITERYEHLCHQLFERCEKLQLSVAQSQSVQEGLESLLNWVEGVEKNLEGQRSVPASSAAIQDALADVAKVKQDLASHNGSVDATREMVCQFLEKADGSTAATLQDKLSELNDRVSAVCTQQRDKEEMLKVILPKVELYEELSKEMQNFTDCKTKVLAAGNQPDRDITQFSQQIKELNSEMCRQQVNLQTLQHVTNELGACNLLANTSQLQEAVQRLSETFNQLQETVKEREKETFSCQQQLSEFRVLVDIIRKWLKESEAAVPSTETSVNREELTQRKQLVKTLLADWTAKGLQVQEVSKKGNELETLIIEITSPDMQTKSGYVLSSAVGVPAASTNGYHTCKDLTEIQCSVCDVNQGYKSLGALLKEREKQLETVLDQMFKVEEEAGSILKWLEQKEQTLSALSASPSKTEAVSIQVDQNKALLADLEQNAEKVQKLKETLQSLLQKHPDSPEAEKWKTMLEEIDTKWAYAKQVTAERQQKLEQSVGHLTAFQTAEAQLSPWLTEKELMMSVLGPLSIDPNMLNAQKQQVQFMLKEFETRKPQYDQLNQSSEGILSSPEDISQSCSQIQDQLKIVSDKWNQLTGRLSTRYEQIDQAIVKSTEYQDLLQQLSERVKAIGQRLSSQGPISTQPDAVKQQLEETSEIRSDLEQQQKDVEACQILCEELSALVGEQYLKDELRKRLEAIVLPLRSLEDTAGERVNQLQTALASSQQFQQMFDELRSWLDTKRSQQSQSAPISAMCETLQAQILEQEEFQKSLNQHAGSYEMIVAEGESLLLSVQPGEEKTALQNQLTTLKAHWDELGKQAGERHSKLKDCMQKAQKYRHHVEDLLPWVENCEVRVENLEVTMEPSQLEASLLSAKSLQHEVEKHRTLLEMLNSAADILLDTCQADEDEVRDEKAGVNQRMDTVTEQLQTKTSSIEELGQRLKEFQENVRNIEKKLEGAKQQLEIYDALGPQACSNKNLERLKTQQESLQALQSQVDYLKNLTQGLVEDAPAGSDASQLLNQAEVIQQEYKNVKHQMNECCQSMENKLQGIGQFHSHVREMFSQLTDLDDELDCMSPIGRDIDSLQSQIEDIRQLMGKLLVLRTDIEASEKECRQMLETEGSPDLLSLKRELEALNKQCGKLTDRSRNRQEQLESILARVKEFYDRLKDVNQLMTAAEGGETLQGVVGTEVDIINQQLASFKSFQKEQVDPIQIKLQQVNGLGQGLIQSAVKNADIQGLEHDLEDSNVRWNTLNKKVAERITQLQEALLHCGKFQDALEPLLSWLTDTEDLINNQKAPSAEYKVVKAQIQEQKLLQRLLDDRKATVEIIKAEGERIAQSAEPSDKEKISKQLQSLTDRWDALLGKAAARQKQLEDILVLAKEFHETMEPLADWLIATEKKLANSEPVGTQTAKIQQQITRHKALEEDIASHAALAEQVAQSGQALLSLTSAVDQRMLADKIHSVQAQYSEVQDWCRRKAALLEQALSNARIFGEEEVEALNWLADVQDKLSRVFVRDYKCEVLQKQHAEQLALNEEILSRKKNMEQAVKNGQALLKQTTGEEVLIIQEKLDGIKTRHAEITATSSKALKTLEQALQLATKFQSTHEELSGWLDSVEEELTSSERRSPVGEKIPQFQQRQKELKNEVMEHRLVLDTINEVSTALLELVPWRAREGLDRLVSEANSRYKSASDIVAQRVEQIDAAIQRSQQYEQATDAELAWVAETKRKLMALGPIRLEQDQTTAQLQVQKAFSIDIIRHKDSIDELIKIQDEILGACGEEQKTILQEKTASLLQKYDEVSLANSERYALLERAQVLVNQFWETHEELCPWLDETLSLITQLPPPAVDPEILKQQQDEMRQLRESIAEHKPHIDKLLKIGPQLSDLNPEEAELVSSKYSTAEALYARIKDKVRQRAVVLDEAVAQSTQFHDKIEPMLEALEHLADRLRSPPSIPAEMDKIREQISENKNIGMELEKLQPSFEALKHRGEELISRSQGVDKDPAAKAIQERVDQMVFFWDEIRVRAEERETKLLDVLELAEKFWCDMTALLSTIRDTQEIVRDLEEPGIDPSIIKQQMEAAEAIKEETDGLHEELEFVRILGTDLIFACGETEKPEVKKSIDEMNNTWENLNKSWKERMDKLQDAMLAAVLYQDALQGMFDWLDNAVIRLCDLSPVGTDLETVKQQINEMKEFKMDIYQQQVEMEKLNHQGDLLMKKASDDTDRDIIQEPLTELKHLWENLDEKITQRQHKLEAALLALGQFTHALAELMAWLTHTEELLDAQRPVSSDPKFIEIELAKHHVLKNDVLAHQVTVQTVNKAGNELLESSAGDDASSLQQRLDKLNHCWESVLQKTEEREQQLESALQMAQGFHGEVEDFFQWLSKMETQLSVSKPMGGLPETAREQLKSHMEIYNAFKSREETYRQLLDKGRLMLLSRDDTSGSNTEQSLALLEQKWQSVSTKMEDRRSKLEDVLNLATEFQNSLQDFINWLTQAEQTLNMAPPPSLILDTVLSQVEDHKVFLNEVNSHREHIMELDKTGNQLKFLSQKQDVVLIKNLLISMKSRWDKVVQRSFERGKALDDARKRAKQFYDAWRKLVDWLEEAEGHLDSDLDISNEPDKIKLQLSKHKEFQKTLGVKQPVYDTTIRTGRSMKEKAALSDDIPKLENVLGEVRDKWDTVCGKSIERQNKLEEALLFSGQFTDALQALVDWLYKVEPQLAEDQPVHGDLDLVMNLMDAHKVFQKELGKRTGSVQALKRSARELLENSRDDTTWVKVQLQELSTRWDTVCKLSLSKQSRLEQAMKQAEEFRAAVQILLEWLSEAEQTLRFRGALPDDPEALHSLIDIHKEFMNKVEEKRVDVNRAAGMGEAILAVCHPDCITTVKHWITIIRARFEEVLTWARQHQQRLELALAELVTNANLLDELLAWLQWAETTLIQQDQEPIPQAIDQVKDLISQHQSFMEEMTRKQPDVDKLTKTYKRKSSESTHATYMDKTRNRKSLNQNIPPTLPLLSQAETKNPRINQLSGHWQQVWLLALERQRKLNDALDRLEELKEFANFDFDVWRKKYMRWMNHKKSRVMDFFRRIDKDQDGKITRQEFIDGILASKFPTTKLEMTAVADIFDRDCDGYIDYYEFVAALHPNKDAYRPTTDADKIEDEVTRQVAQCKCAKRFQVEQIGENKYRFFLGNQFGDSQQLRLVRILRSTVMVRVGGGWMALDEFLVKNDPCRVHHPGSKIARSDSSTSISSPSMIARGRTNLELREKFILPEGMSQGMAPFRSRGRRSKPSSRTASPTRSSSSTSHSNHSCASMPSSPATPASGAKTPQQFTRFYDKPWLASSKTSTPVKAVDQCHCEATPTQGSKLKRPTFHSSKGSLTGETSTFSSPASTSAKPTRTDPKKTTSRPTSQAGSRTGSRTSSRRGSDASDFDLLETQSACSDLSETSTPGSQAGSRRGSAKPSKIPTISKKASAASPKTPGTKR